MSARTRVELEPAYVIHHRPYRETSVLLELLTEHHGRTGVVGKGARRPRSRQRGLLQPFQPLLVSWVSRGELGTLTGVEASRPVGGLRGNALLSGFYVNELVYRIIERHDPSGPLFLAYECALDELHDGTRLEAALRLFEKRLLDAIGYGLVLDRAADGGGAIDPDVCYEYVAERGPVVVARPRADTVSGATLLGLAAEQLERQGDAAEAKRFMRAMLLPFLGPRPIASREMFALPMREPLSK